MVNFIKLKKKIKKNEGYRNKPYLDILGNPTIGFGHLIKEDQKNLLNKKHSKKKLSYLFDLDFNIAFNSYLKCHKEDLHSNNTRDVLVEMIFQLGMKKQKKFTKMNRYIKERRFFMAAFEMKNSLWYNQTPKRVDGLIDTLLKDCYEKKR